MTGGKRLLALLLFLGGCHAAAVRAPLAGLRFQDLQYNPESVVQYEGEQTVRISPEDSFIARVEIRPNGNGELSLMRGEESALTVKIYDQHAEDDPYAVFEGGMLSYRFVDTEGRGLLDLEVRETRLIQKDRSNEVLQRSTIRELYRYEPGRGVWSKVP